MQKKHMLFLVILIEGYVVLACELLAIRQLVPFVGSGVEPTAIIISGVLLPLAIGYHFGGIAYARAFRIAKKNKESRRTIRHLLLRNILISLALISFGFSYLFLEFFFLGLGLIGLTHHLVQTAVYVSLFLVTPMFLLGQTVPLTSHYFSKQKLSQITGRMLFFSTIGAFLGSLFTTLVLMPTVGVHNAVMFTMALLLGLLWLVSSRNAGQVRLAGVALFLLAWFLNNDAMFRVIKIASNNAYNLIMVSEDDRHEGRYIIVNRSLAGYHAFDPENRLEYIKYVERYFIDPTLKTDAQPMNILVLGAGGFNLGRYDTKNNYLFVDIDKDIKDVAEQHLLKEPLGPNKKFVAASAREFVHNDKELYDLILIDVCTNMVSIPMEAVTQGFFKEVRARLKKGGVVVSNTVGSPSFADAFSARYYNTFASIFPKVTRVPLDQPSVVDKRPVTPSFEEIKNVLLIYADRGFDQDSRIYTDDKNTYSFDMPSAQPLSDKP